MKPLPPLLNTSVNVPLAGGVSSSSSSARSSVDLYSLDSSQADFPSIPRNLSQRPPVGYMEKASHIVSHHRTQTEGNVSGSFAAGPYWNEMTHFVVSLTHELKNRGKLLKKREYEPDLVRIYSEERKAQPVEKEIRAWKKILPVALQSKINLNTWKSYRENLPNTDTFSAFLVKLRYGFLLIPQLPSFSFSKGLYSKSKYRFAHSRLLPVLLAMQEKPDLAARLCSIAEDGLGNCHDRPVLTFVDIELEVACENVLSKVGKLLLEEPNSPLLDEAFQQLVSLEAQKLKKTKAISFLVDAFRSVPDGGGIDPEQNVIVSYNKIAKAIHSFPQLPYITSTIFVDSEVQHDIRERVISYLTEFMHTWPPSALETHLLNSDNWIRLLVMKIPSLDAELANIGAQRLQASEALVHDQVCFDGQYAEQLNTLNAEHMRARSILLNSVEIRTFTRAQVSQYLVAIKWS